MKDFLMTSTVPYWFMLFLVIASTGICLAGAKLTERFPKLSGNAIIILVTATCFATVAGEWLIFLTVKTGCLWWCLSKDLNFFEKFFRSILLFIFLLCQILQVVTYKKFIEATIGKSGLQVKSTIIGALILVPAMVIIFLLLDMLGIGKTLRNIISYAFLIIGIVICIGKSLHKNTSAAGFIPGTIFTVTSIIIVSGSLISVMLLFNVVFTLFFQFIIFVALLAACKMLFPALSGTMASSTTQFNPRFRDDDGNLHRTPAEMDAANARIRASKNN